MAVAASHVFRVAIFLSLRKRQLKKYITIAQQALQRLIGVFQHL